MEISSRAAAKEEANRRQRVSERRKFYEQIEETEVRDGRINRCVLEYDLGTKEPLVEVEAALVRDMKPHQVEGVKFLYDTVIESIEQVSQNAPGSGAILAHCMGLGKTFQVISFLQTVMTHGILKRYIRKVIVVCPCNVVLNWVREFEMWIDENEDVKDALRVYECSGPKNIHERLEMLEDWSRNGGVFILGYSMFRLMSRKNAAPWEIEAKLPLLLHDPGADLVVCDEGHLLKNGKTQISKAMNLIRTKRRVILTGTPLQNNMSEYHCMLSFVKPNLLGTHKEFNNRFLIPITYGQELHATVYAVRRMRKRVHILNQLLAGCIHRRDYNHLTPYLPTKFEYIISIELSDMQKNLYRQYLDYIGIGEDTPRERLKRRMLLMDYQVLKMVWTHPSLVTESEHRREQIRQRRTSKQKPLNLDDSIGAWDSLVFGQIGQEEILKFCGLDEFRFETQNEQAGPVDISAKGEPDKWWSDVLPSGAEELESLALSSKLSLAFEILRESELVGDKVILFSTSILTLDLVERNLRIEYDRAVAENPESSAIRSWLPGVDYFRLDGKTDINVRKRDIDQFNDPRNRRARLFLVSTKAGGNGTNMVGANRVIVLDASWNPSDDSQAVFRVYRFGQTKPVFVYRLVAHATMEEKIYDRQVSKISLACRVVDEQNLERHFNEADLRALYEFKPEKDARRTPSIPKDPLLAELLLRCRTLIRGYHEHDSLLRQELEDELTEEERKQAWKEYEDERDGKAPPRAPTSLSESAASAPGKRSQPASTGCPTTPAPFVYDVNQDPYWQQVAPHAEAQDYEELHKQMLGDFMTGALPLPAQSISPVAQQQYEIPQWLLGGVPNVASAPDTGTPADLGKLLNESMLTAFGVDDPSMGPK
ncbi:transcriptional regulator ATRX homolog [Galendromus occidentalis]|uniref:Transcriptional regulator ATRX homolog n=1 Tax=Galendromus occidentalis TaxID=34638 RepID=A0AAJ6QT31_9ACAR|nr:transcriptional regulator ATRX homolog [Galendromus occidentalis]